MSVNISVNNIITITKGDYVCVPLFINIGTRLEMDNYTLKEGDIVYFSIMEPNQKFEEGVIRKTFNKNNLDSKGLVNIKIESTETDKILPGRYYMEIKLKLASGAISTIVPKTKFYIYS